MPYFGAESGIMNQRGHLGLDPFIAHILQRSTNQPQLPILPLPPILPAVPIMTPLSPPITRPATPAPRVVPVVQPMRVKLSQPAPTAHPMVQHAPLPSIHLSTNPWI